METKTIDTSQRQKETIFQVNINIGNLSKAGLATSTYKPHINSRSSPIPTKKTVKQLPDLAESPNNRNKTKQTPLTDTILSSQSRIDSAISKQPFRNQRTSPSHPVLGIRPTGARSSPIELNAIPLPDHDNPIFKLKSRNKGKIPRPPCTPVWDIRTPPINRRRHRREVSGGCGFTRESWILNLEG